MLVNKSKVAIYTGHLRAKLFLRWKNRGEIRPWVVSDEREKEG